jgi:hypothetical protein
VTSGGVAALARFPLLCHDPPPCETDPPIAAACGDAGPSLRPLPLRDRLAAAGRTIGERESAHEAALGEAHQRAEALRAQVAEAVEAFHAAAARAGSPHLRLAVGPVR